MLQTKGDGHLIRMMDKAPALIFTLHESGTSLAKPPGRLANTTPDSSIPTSGGARTSLHSSPPSWAAVHTRSIANPALCGSISLPTASATAPYARTPTKTFGNRLEQYPVYDPNVIIRLKFRDESSDFTGFFANLTGLGRSLHTEPYHNAGPGTLEVLQQIPDCYGLCHYLFNSRRFYGAHYSWFGSNKRA